MPKGLARVARLAVVAGLVATGATFGPARAQEGPGPLGPAVVGGCRAAVGTQGDPACRTLEQGTRVGSELCRFAGGRPEACAQFDGLVISEDSMRQYEASWVHVAHVLQRALDDATPLRQALFPATHNSFNSAAYAPTLSRSDHNQLYSMRDQLRMDMRGIEIDVHWSYSAAARPEDGGKAPVTCHANEQEPPTGPVHVGCTTEETLDVALHEVRGWLDANPREVLLLYLENGLESGNETAHARAAEMIEAELGPLVYRPTSPCGSMPTGLSRADIRSTGAQVLIVGNCGPGAWGSWVHERDQDHDVWAEESSGNGLDFDCAADRTKKNYESTFVRFYEDSTGLTYTVGGGSPPQLTAPETAAMAACGVNLFGFDQLQPGDARLARIIWSWAPLGWTGGDCAYSSGADGRFHAGSCDTKRRVACQDPATGAWTVSAKAVAWKQGFKECKKSLFAVPATGWENTRLRAAATAAGDAEVWLNYAKAGDAWTPRLAGR